MSASVQPDLTGHVELPWHRGPLASFDTETTGTNVLEDRIVSAALIQRDGTPRRWLSDVDGVEIPAEAYDVHKISTEHARTHGKPAKQVVEEITHALALEMASGFAALVVMNAPFDLSLLNAECARHGVKPLAERIGDVAPVVDPLVMDRAADKYRKGKRTLEALAVEYGVELTAAHSADADAQAALDVARAIAEAYPSLQVPARVLHGWQVHWHEAWAENFQAFLRRSGKPDSVVDGSWPFCLVGGAE